MRSALGRPLILLLSGSLAGLLLGVLASRLLAQIVYEATPMDPVGVYRSDGNDDIARIAGDLDSSAAGIGD